MIAPRNRRLFEHVDIHYAPGQSTHRVTLNFNHHIMWGIQTVRYILNPNLKAKTFGFKLKVTYRPNSPHYMVIKVQSNSVSALVADGETAFTEEGTKIN